MTGPRGGYQLGIDLGTTFTAAAVCRSDERRWVEPEVVGLGSRSATVPSVLFLAPDGAVVVGEAAERRAHTDPDRVAREVKRRIGDPTPVVVAGRAHAPEELSALLVRWVVDRVAEREGGPAARIAVTHPASWGPHKLGLLAGALGAHGLTATFLAEPQAAALHYAAAERVEPGSTIAVYDLGGGTFDAAVVRKAEPGRAGAAFGLLGRPEGLDGLGGIDFDEVVFEHVREALPEAFAALDPADPAVLSAVARIRRDCTEAKEALSADTEVTIPVLLPAARGSVRLHRSEFEALVRPLVEETVTALRGAVTSAHLTPEQLTAVLLVGGSSRIPLVTQLVSEGLGRPVAVDADPKNAIAKGAALAVSPRPTASWPGVAVPPVPAGPTVALAGAAAAAAGAAARSRSAAPPPRPAHTPPRGAPRVAGPVHEPATSLFSGRDPDPAPPRPQVRAPAPVPAAGPEDRRRGLLVGAGALAAAAVVVLAVVLLNGAPAGFDATGTSVSTSPTPSLGDPGSAVPPAAPDPAVPAPGGGGTAPDAGGAGAGGGTGGGGGGGGGAAPGGGAPPAGGGAPAGGTPPDAGEPTAPDGAATPAPGGDPTAPVGTPAPAPTPDPTPLPPAPTPTGDASGGGGDAGGGTGGGTGGAGGGPTAVPVPVDTGTAAGGSGGPVDPRLSAPAGV